MCVCVCSGLDGLHSIIGVVCSCLDCPYSIIGVCAGLDGLRSIITVIVQVLKAFTQQSVLCVQVNDNNNFYCAGFDGVHPDLALVAPV